MEQLKKNLDQVSLDRIKKLHPKLRDEALKLFTEASALLTGRAIVRITQGYRTFAEQQSIYSQGRTTKGKIVTNAKPGSSFHNYGLAIDIVLIIDGKEAVWDRTKDFDADGQADWMEVVNYFKKHGWVSGGDFRSIKDWPHLEKSFGKSWQQLLVLHNMGKVDQDGYVII